MEVIDTKVKVRVSTLFEFKIQAGIFRVQTLKFDSKPKKRCLGRKFKIDGHLEIQFSGVDKISCCLRLISKFLCS